VQRHNTKVTHGALRETSSALGSRGGKLFMFVIIGLVIVLGSVVGGYLMVNGPLGVLMQPSEMVIICGAAIGAVVMGTPLKMLKLVAQGVPRALKGSPYNKALFVELLRLQYEIYINAKKGGLISLENDVNDPGQSAIFTKYPAFLANHHAVDFFCDAMRMLINGAAQPEELEISMETEMETHHEESAIAPAILTRVADSLPGLGIVAAVLGIVVTMQHLDGPPEELGHHVGAALVGTFLGLLFSYGMVAPLSANIESISHDEAKYFACIKAGVVAFANGAAPMTAVEFARKTIFSCDRPSNMELEPQLREIRPR
jgi:chemotaxis protein MotA